MIITHLIGDDGLSETLNQPRNYFGVLSLVCESRGGTLFQQFLGQYFDLLESTALAVEKNRS